MSALWSGEALAKATGGALTPGCAGLEVSAVGIDTRTLRPGALFVALRSERGDGHAHLAAAADAGATCAMVHDAVPDAPASLPLLRVDDTTAALARLGRAARDRFAGMVVAVTGSVGKTTTKEMLRTALAAFGPVHAAEASHNNHWGVPLTLARLPADARFAVIEIGTNHPGEIVPLAALARPDIAIVTAVGDAHLGPMGGRDAIAREKASIYASLRPGGVAVLPADATEAAALLHAAVPDNVRTLRFGRAPGSEARLADVRSGEVRSGDIRPGDTRADGDATVASIVIDGATRHVRIGALGAHMASNAAAVLAAVHALGLDLDRAASTLAAFRPGAGRGLTSALRGGRATLLDESYNASGASMRAAFEVLSLLPARRRIAFLGDMLELGDEAEALHAALAGPAARAADIVHTSGPLSRALHAALPPERRGRWTEDAETLAAAAPALVDDGDAVLVKGSNGSRMRLVVAALRAPIAPTGDGR